MSDPLTVVVEGQAIWPHSVKDCPDYLNDLNAMHEAEKTLKVSEIIPYGENVGHDMKATAAQRAEAFLKTLNLYK